MFSLNYKSKSKWMDTVDEIVIQCHKKENELNHLEDFLQEHSNQRIVLDLPSNVKSYELDLFDPYFIKYPNFVLRLQDVNEDYFKRISEIDEKARPHVFVNRIVSTWDGFIWMLSQPITDIYVSEELGFELNNVAAAAHEAGVKIRVYPNVAQSQFAIDPLKKFFIRPEDIQTYSEYVDVFEFWQGEGAFPQEQLYKIYAVDCQWFGDLSEIISRLDIKLDSRYIVPIWAYRRVKCNKRCYKGGLCNICETVHRLSGTLESAGLIIKPKDQPLKHYTEEDAKKAEEELDNLKEKIKDMKATIDFNKNK